jgi:glucuronoxylan 4-O-methyltransferase
VWDERIRALVAENPGQATFEEYKLVVDVVVERAPCRMLVFGVGRDSTLWIDANRAGTTVFLEDNRAWAAHARDHVSGIEVHDVRYRTIRALWPVYRRWPGLLQPESFPSDVRAAPWDIVLVDGPRGTRWYRPGRMKSVLAARQFAAPGAEVFIHDCNRTVERESGDVFLGADRLVSQAGSMRHYRLA